MRRLFSSFAFLVLFAGAAHAESPDADVVENDGGPGHPPVADTLDAGQAIDGSFLRANDPDAGPPSLKGGSATDNGNGSYETVTFGRKHKPADATEDTTVIDGQRLRDSPRGTTFEAISQEAGDIYVTGRGFLNGVANGASGGISIRGLGGSPNDEILVVEDGVPDFQGIFGHPIPDAYAPFLIDEVEVIKGGDSVLYGTNAMGGVIQIRSRWLKTEGWDLEIDSAYGSYNTLRESAAFLGRFGGWDAAGGVFVLKTDGQRDGAGGDEMIGQAAVRYRFGNGVKLTFREKVVHLDGADPGTVQHPTPGDWYDVWRENASFNLAYASGILKLRATPYLNLGVHRLYDGFYSLDYTVGGIVETDLALHKMVDLLLGVATDYMNGDVKNRITGEVEDVQAMADFSFYNQLTVKPVPSLAIVLGTRELYSLTYGFVFLYKAGVRWDVINGLYLHTRVARNFRQPTIRELYLPYPVANPDLKPEYALNWDFGFGWEYGRFEVSCTGYRTEADNLIKYFGAWPSAEVVNIGHVVVWGVEGRAGFRRLGPVSFFVTGDWQDVGQYTRQNPSAKLDFSLDAEKDFGAHYVGGSLTGEWVHGLYMANYARQPIPDVFFMDLAFRYRYTSHDRGFSLEPYVYLRNILNSRYEYISGYTMPGFNVLAGLKAEI